MLGTAISLADHRHAGHRADRGLAAAWLFDLSPLEALIVGSAVAATDSAAIFAVLRGSN